METSQLIYSANQLTCFYMMGTGQRVKKPLDTEDANWSYIRRPVSRKLFHANKWMTILCKKLSEYGIAGIYFNRWKE